MQMSSIKKPGLKQEILDQASSSIMHLFFSVKFQINLNHKLCFKQIDLLSSLMSVSQIMTYLIIRLCAKSGLIQTYFHDINTC
jgi:hypothetical protein